MTRRKTVSFHPLDRSSIYGLQSKKRLAQLFGLTLQDLKQILESDQPFSHRELVEDRKGKIKTRVIQEPRGKLRIVHDKVRSILSKIQPPPFLFCPVKQRSSIQNAAQHKSALEIWTLDIKNYFMSTTSHRVFWFFHHVMKCSSDVSATLARLLTVNGHLATGSTVSPILSFYAFFDMWNQIDYIVCAESCTLTVYMDDITVSGEKISPKLKWEIKKKIHARGLDYHKEKRSRSGTLEITGVIHRSGTLAVPNRQLLRAYELRKQLAKELDVANIKNLTAKIAGHRSYRAQVKKAQGA